MGCQKIVPEEERPRMPLFSPCTPLFANKRPPKSSLSPALFEKLYATRPFPFPTRFLANVISSRASSKSLTVAD